MADKKAKTGSNSSPSNSSPNPPTNSSSTKAKESSAKKGSGAVVGGESEVSGGSPAKVSAKKISIKVDVKKFSPHAEKGLDKAPLVVSRKPKVEIVVSSTTAASMVELPTMSRVAEKEKVAQGPGKRKVDKLGRPIASGKRKASIASVILKSGTGVFVVNGRKIEEYFTISRHRATVLQPLVAVEMERSYDVVCKVVGGGVSGQAGAVRHAIARALINVSEDLRPVLKSLGYLTRDSRIVERKKPGLRKARRREQFSKR